MSSHLWLHQFRPLYDLHHRCYTVYRDMKP